MENTHNYTQLKKISERKEFEGNGKCLHSFQLCYCKPKKEEHLKLDMHGEEYKITNGK